MPRRALSSGIPAFLAILLSVLASQANDKWEDSIRRFEAEDSKAQPPKQAVLFVGSSSIVGWNLKKFFPDLVTINRGFGGSQIADSIRFVDRIVTPYEPRAIVFYAGDNDLADGKTPEQVEKDFREFVLRVRAKLPEVPILFLGIKPSKQRWHLIDKIRDANKRIESTCKAGTSLTFVSVESAMLGEDGKPRSELLQKDGLHLTDAGYALWSELVRKNLPQ